MKGRFGFRIDRSVNVGWKKGVQGMMEAKRGGERRGEEGRGARGGLGETEGRNVRRKKGEGRERVQRR